jgi:hypothetical protein
MNVKDLAASGVTLTPSTSADFGAQVEALIGTPSPADAPLIPYSLIVKNLTGQTIRGYALQWTYIGQNGATADANYQVQDDFDPRQVGGAEIPPGGARVLSPSGLLRPSSITYAASGSLMGPNTIAKLANYASINVSLDAVAFDDGKIIGPNEGFAMNIWGAIHAAQRDVGMAALQKSHNSSADDVVIWLTSQSAQPEVHPANATMHERLAGSSHWYQVYARMAFQRLLEFSTRSYDAMLAEASNLAQTPVPTLSR